MRTKFIKDSDSAHVVHLFDLNRTELIRKIEKSMFKKKFEESMNLCFSDNVEEPSSLFLSMFSFEWRSNTEHTSLSKRRRGQHLTKAQKQILTNILRDYNPYNQS